jgi:hypothetical protein
VNPRPEQKEAEDFSHFLNAVIFEKPYTGDLKDKKALLLRVQEEWYNWAEEKNVTRLKTENEALLDYIREMCLRISKEKSGHADTPKMVKLLPESQNGLSCLSSSLVLSALLEKQNIPYSFLNPVGHIVLQVNDHEKQYYVDARNNKIIDMAPYLLEVEDHNEYDVLHFSKETQGKFYSYALRFKQKENELQSVFGNVIVLNNINKGDESGASPAIDFHRKTAESIKPILDQLNFTSIENIHASLYPHEDAYLKKIRLDDEQRLHDSGFYS